MQATIRRIADGIARTFGVTIEVDIPQGNPVTTNAPAERDIAAAAVQAAGLPLRRDIQPAMTGEDFAWFLQERPGAFVWIGNGSSDGGRDLHNANYDYNDAILPAASGYLGVRRETGTRRRLPVEAPCSEADDAQLPACQQHVGAYDMTEIPAKYLDLLSQKVALANLATIQPDGSPQVTPVWFDFTGGVVRVNTAKGRVKARNMAVGSKVALSIVDPDNPYRYIQIRGSVTKETTDGAKAHIDSLAKKYLDKDVYPWHNPKRRPGDVRDHAGCRPRDGLERDDRRRNRRSGRKSRDQTNTWSRMAESKAMSSCSSRSPRDAGVDPSDEVRGQGTGLGSGDAAGEFGAVLYAQHQRVDVQSQRIPMCDKRRILSDLGTDGAEAGRTLVIQHLGVVGWHVPIDGRGQSASLHRANAHDADAIGACGCHHGARLRGVGVEFQPARAVQQIGDALHGGGLRVLGHHLR